MVAEARVIEEDAGNDERPRQRAPSGLIGTGNVTGAELAVEAKELLSGANGHAAEDSRVGGRVFVTDL